MTHPAVVASACRPANPGEEDACAKRILSTLMRRAYRRPVSEQDLQAPFRFYSEGRMTADSKLALRWG